MIVMTIARTPSLNASSRLLRTAHPLPDAPRRPAPQDRTATRRGDRSGCVQVGTVTVPLMTDTTASAPRTRDGVRHMLDACKACGWSRIYWRVCDAGQATYASRVMRPAEFPE